MFIKVEDPIQEKVARPAEAATKTGKQKGLRGFRGKKSI